MVAKRSIYRRRSAEKFVGDIRSDNVGMSNIKKCLKTFSS